MPQPPLAGVRIIESSMLGPGAITTHLADLGADVIKVESPQGDYIRQMTWPIVEGVSLMHLHISRGKRSIVLDLRTDEGVATYLDLVRGADVVIEAMRPGGLERRGLGFERLCEVNPRIVFCTISGYGMTGPYKDMPSHGIAYDVWAGLVQPEEIEDGFVAIPEHPSMGIHAGPLFGALGVLAAVIRARATGDPSRLEIAQSDAAAAMDWLRSETWRAYERPEDEVTGNASDDYQRRAPGTAGMRDGVRYQFYETKNGHILFQASEREFWENFCRGIDRADLFERYPGSKYADHAVGNIELRTELREIFRGRTSAEWVQLGERVNTPIVNVNTPKTIADDPQFQDRMPWLPRDVLGCEQLPSPIKLVGETLAVPSKAPTPGQHTDEVLREVLGYDAERIGELRSAGALG
ncbi:MAG TPA: CoA transferase [Acidimicrobiales bacterium]|nr:CoA transferase [Acidimicrobiales bacterium]